MRISANPLHPRYSRAARVGRHWAERQALAPEADARPFDPRTNRALTAQEASDPFYEPARRGWFGTIVDALFGATPDLRRGARL